MSETATSAAPPAAVPVSPQPGTAPEPRHQPIQFERVVSGAPRAPVEPKAEAAPAVKPSEPTEAKPVEKKPEPRISAALAQLQLRERKIVQREQQWKQQTEAQRQELSKLQADLKAQQDSLQAQFEELRQFQAAKKDPMKWLEAGGFTYDALAQQVINDGNVPPEVLLQRTRSELETKLDSKTKELESKFEASEKAREEAERKQREAAAERAEREAAVTMQRFNQEVLDFGTTNASRFPITLAFKQEGQVPALIEAYYRESLQADSEVAKQEGREPVGKILSKDEAWGLMENHLKSLYEEAGKKLQPTVVPAAAPAAAVAAPAAPAAAPTLSNNLNASPPPQREEFLTDDQRWKRALAAMDQVQAARGGTQR